mgnify:FL=1|tara:strand:- start:158 stop:727 length:570 start_codon:yes stop_codon:yes gene_type:complete
MNNKNIFYFLILIPILFSCTATIYEQPSPTYSIIYEGKEATGNWEKYNIDDPFNGKWTRSHVYGEGDRYRKPRLIVDFYPESNNNYDGFGIGLKFDTFMCTAVYRSYNLKYVADGLSPFSIPSYSYAIEDDTIWFRNRGSVEMQSHMLHMLNIVDEIIFEIEPCGDGDTKRAKFNVTGQHHLTTSYLEE